MGDTPRPTFTLFYVENSAATQREGGIVHLTIRRPNAGQSDILIQTPYGTDAIPPQTFRENYEILLNYHEIGEEDSERMTNYLLGFIRAVHQSTDTQQGIPSDIYFTITDYNPEAMARIDRDFVLTNLDTQKRLPTQTEANEECPICLETFEGEGHVNKLNCGHIYHSRCIAVWVFSKLNCPVCRSTDIC